MGYQNILITFYMNQLHELVMFSYVIEMATFSQKGPHLTNDQSKRYCDFNWPLISAKMWQLANSSFQVTILNDCHLAYNVIYNEFNI